MSDTAVTIRDAVCRSCGTQFRTGAAAPSCPRCNSGNITVGTAHTVAVPSPVPAGVMPTNEQMAAQVGAQLANTQQLTYRCPMCPWTTTYPAVAEPPASITAHEQTHAGELLV